MCLFVANNPLKYVDPSGEHIELTGDTEEERLAAFERIKAMVGKEGAKHLSISVAYGRKDRKAHYFVQSDLKFKDTSKLASYLDQMIQSSKTTEYKIAESFTTKSGTVITTGGNTCGDACTVGAEDSVNGHTQIFVNKYSGAISEGVFNSPLVRGAFAAAQDAYGPRTILWTLMSLAMPMQMPLKERELAKLASLIHGQRNSRIYSGLIQVIPPGPGSQGLGNETQFVFENGSSKNVDCISVSAIFSDLQHQPPRQMESSSQ